MMAECMMREKQKAMQQGLRQDITQQM